MSKTNAEEEVVASSDPSSPSQPESAEQEARSIEVEIPADAETQPEVAPAVEEEYDPAKDPDYRDSALTYVRWMGETQHLDHANISFPRGKYVGASPEVVAQLLAMPLVISQFIEKES